VDLKLNLILAACDLLIAALVRRGLQHAPGARSAWGALSAPILLLLVAGPASSLLASDFFGVLRGLCWALFIHLPVMALAVALAATSVAAALAIIGTDAFLVEPAALEVTHYDVHSPKLHESVRVVVLADIQTDGVGAHERAALATAAAQHPDLVLLTGDYVQAEPPDRRQVAHDFTAALREAQLSPRLGAFAVRGNVDGASWTELFEGTGVTAISPTRSFDAGPLRLSALSLGDSFNPQLDLPRSEQFQVAFGHSPDFALGGVEADLLVAGHTHGGQVQVAGMGPVITYSEVPRSWASGLTRLARNRTLVVSRGIGMERNTAPRLRFNCRPEIVVIDLKPAG
jgi:predicted MPP superfamily phosphohydrolase